MSDTTRRDFFKLSAMFAGAAGIGAMLPDAIRRAAAIDPAPGSTFLDAEHVVILMQENRSFDHAFGTLRGVRGFSDPRAIALPDGNPVWVQPDTDGQRYAPFRMDIQNTSATWLGSIPHSWTDQVDARNGGRCDAWIPNKRSGAKGAAAIPMTMGYYTRADIPFYYELADAFTVCDQTFCSSLTGTTPNRCYLWSGTIRHEPTPESQACVLNSNVDYGSEASWTTFPERLEDLGVSWKIYQNEISMDTGLTGDEESWLSNFTDNSIEFFAQFNVRFHAKHREHLKRYAERLTRAIEVLEKKADASDLTPDARAVVQQDLERRTAEFNDVQEQLSRWSEENFNKLSQRERNLHLKAFATNTGDPDYRSLTELTYQDGDQERRIAAPKGDIFHQFRQDVERGELPTVSWLVAPERFSDHPTSAWFGAWYIAEALDILTKNPETWKKTIFILTYDENDGYFDHVPPFVAPHVDRPETGRTSPGAAAPEEYVTLEEDMRYKSRKAARDSSIGLGYRVPLVVASPWSRGGCVCSQVFDHTSPLQFMERWLSHKLGKPVIETNISAWRRAVCGDLTSAFQRATDEPQQPLEFPPRDVFIERIDRARYKNPPANYHALAPEELEDIRRDPLATPLLARQEPGTRPSAPLPYELSVEEGPLKDPTGGIALEFAAGATQFADRSAGAPFIAYARLGDDVDIRNFAVAPGERVDDIWLFDMFPDRRYDIAVYGPNGFFREFRGDAHAAVSLRLEERRDARGATVAVVHATNRGRTAQRVLVADVAYGHAPQAIDLPAGATISCALDAQQSGGWYDLRVTLAGRAHFERRYAGRIETGRWSTSDPQIGRA